MNDEYPEVPAHFTRALQFTLDEAEILEVWQVLCDSYGEPWAGTLTLTIRAKLPVEEEA